MRLPDQVLQLAIGRKKRFDEEAGIQTGARGIECLLMGDRLPFGVGIEAGGEQAAVVHEPQEGDLLEIDLGAQVRRDPNRDQRGVDAMPCQVEALPGYDVRLQISLAPR